MAEVASELISQGAEGRIYRTEFLGRPAVMKERFRKTYRLPELDQKLLKQRLLQEVRCIVRCRRAGMRTTDIYFVDTHNCRLYLEFIQGSTAKHFFLSTDDIDKKRSVAQQIGAGIARMHDASVTHGDLTTSNMMVDENMQLVFIDFGLGSMQAVPEDKAVDLYVMERAFLSTHPDSDMIVATILEEYQQRSKGAKAVFDKLQQNVVSFMSGFIFICVHEGFQNSAGLGICSKATFVVTMMSLCISALEIVQRHFVYKMIPPELQVTTLPYILACAGITSYLLKKQTRQRLNATMTAIVALLAVKLAVESHLRAPNYYETLGVAKGSSVMQIHRAFKVITSSSGSRNDFSPDAVQKIRHMYEVLMETETRDAYNRFGDEGLLMNVHIDELQLIIHLAVPYIFWAGVVLLITTEAATRPCRPWIATAGIALMIVDTLLCVTPLSLPSSMPRLFPPTMTEFELRWAMHSMFAGLCMALRAFSVYRHFDAPGCHANIVSLIQVQNDVIRKSLHRIRVTYGGKEVDAGEDATAMAAADPDSAEEEMNKINNYVQRSSEGISQLSIALQTHVNRPRHNYYWILFGLLYVGIYLLGG